MSSPLNVLIFWYIGTVTRLLSVFSLSSQSGISTGNNGQLHTSLSHSPQDNSNSMLPSFPRQHASALMIHNKDVISTSAVGTVRTPASQSTKLRSSREFTETSGTDILLFTGLYCKYGSDDGERSYLANVPQMSGKDLMYLSFSANQMSRAGDVEQLL